MAELGIPLVALGALYIMSNQKGNGSSKSSCKKEGFDSNPRPDSKLPNVDIPDKNFPPESFYEAAVSDRSAHTSTVNRYDGNSYTDKYFNANMYDNLVNTAIDKNNAKYYSLTGEKVDAAYFKHHNMQPYFGSKMRGTHVDANSGESVLDNYIGAGSQIISKEERAPLFTPQENYHFPHGMPNTSDFMQSRVNPSMRMANVNPFKQENVAPGLGQDYGTQGVGGYNSGLMARDMYMPRNVDQMRTDNKPKAGEFMLLGHEGPATSRIQERGHLGIMEKNRVERTFEMGQDRLFTTLGAQTAPTARAIHIDRPQNRPETSAEYSGVAGAHNPAHYVEGEYMPSTHIDLGEVPITNVHRIGAGGANEADYGIKSQHVYQNNRSANQNGGYLGVAGGVLTAAIAPLMDVLRPSRKENTVGNVRQYANPSRTVSNSYVFNPADRLAPTIRETTELSSGHLFVNRGQNANGYEISEHQPIVNNRQTQSDFCYTGNAGAGEGCRMPRTYDAEYNQRNNDLKSSTVVGYTPAGNMRLFNGDINVTAVHKDRDQVNRRAWNPTMPPQTHSVDTVGQSTAGSQQASWNSQIQLDRSQPDILSQLKGNPFVISHINGL